MTLVVLCAALGLLGLARPGTAGLPAAGGWWVAGLLGVMGYHAWPIVFDGTYFDRFQELTVFADGLLLVLMGTWGVWALRQLPVVWFRRLRWAGLGILVANGLAVGWHAWALHSWWPRDNVAGLLGLNRFLGVYAVLWVPILWVWRGWLVALPLLLIAVSGKLTAWIGLIVALLVLRPRYWGVWAGASVAGAVWLVPTDAWVKLTMRLDVWGQALDAIRHHPWLGVGFHPMAGLMIRTASGYQLPTLHSDLLTLALRAGLPLALGTVWAVATLLQGRPRTAWAHALRASLVALVVMSVGHGVLSHARIGGLAVVWLAWWLVEQETEHA